MSLRETRGLVGLVERKRSRRLNRSVFSQAQRRALDALARDLELYVSNGDRVWRWNRWGFSQPLEDWYMRYKHRGLIPIGDI